ncbi:MAG: anti-sigma factor antagonist [Nitrospirae bacterium]|nr:anti-sigma factor antagonist [Nitrospirota bacterium]
MRFTFEKSGTAGHLTLDGELTTERADYVKEALLMAINNADFLVVNFTRVTSLDIFCTQMFCLAYFVSRKRGKHLMVTGLRQEIFKPVQKEQVLNCVFSCSPDNICMGGWAALQSSCKQTGLFPAAPAYSQNDKGIAGLAV